MLEEFITKTSILKPSMKELRIFGIEFFLIFSIIAILMFRQAYPLWIIFMTIGIVFLFLGLISPLFLKGIHKIWMFFSFVLGWIITNIILIVTFFVVVTPLGIILRMFKKDILDQKIANSSTTYWKKSEFNIDRSRHLKQF